MKKATASKKTSNASQQITKQIEELGDWRGTLCARLRKLINEADPNLTEEVKWGTAVWTSNELVCAVGAFKDHVKLNFFKGAEFIDLTHIDGVQYFQKLVAEADGKRVTYWAQGFEINQILVYAHPVPLTDQDVQDLAARNGFNWNGRKPVKGSQEWEWWDFERRKQLGTPHYPFPVVVEYYDPEVAKRVAATRFPFRTRNLHMFVVPIPGSPSLYSAIGIADNNASLADLREFARESLIFKRTEGQSDGIHLGLTKDPNEKNSGQSREAFTRHFTLITYREPDGIEARDIVRQEVVTVTPFFKDNKIVAVEYISDGDLFYADIARIAAQNGLNWTNFEEVPMAQKWIGTIKWNTSIPPHHFQPNPGDAAAGDPIHRLDFLKEFYDPAHNDVHIIVGRLSLSAESFCVDGVDPMISKGYVIRVENADGKMLLANDPRWIIKSQPSNVRGLVIRQLRSW